MYQYAQSYKDLLVWQKAITLVVAVYALTETFPKTEVFGLVSQMRRASVSIPSNIAEGRHRGSRKDFTNFLHFAYSSGMELETQVLLSKQLQFANESAYERVDPLLTEVLRMLNAMIKKMKAAN